MVKRCGPKLDPTLVVMINRLDKVLYASPFPRLLNRTRETKKQCLDMATRYPHFMIYTPNTLLTNQFLDRWIRRALGGCGQRFYYTDGVKKYYAMWLKSDADAAKFTNLIKPG